MDEVDIRSRLPRRHHGGGMAVRVLAAIAAGAVLYYGRPAFEPVAIAVLISLVLTTPVEALHRHGVPRAAAAILMLLIFVGVVGGAVDLLWTPAQNWWASAPKTMRVIEHRIRPVQRLIGRVETLSRRAGLLAPETSHGTAHATITAQAASSGHSVALTVLDLTGSALISILTVIILTIFVLTGGPPMFARMSTALAADMQATRMLTVIDAMRHEVSRYYGSIALINLGLGLATAAIEKLLGMPNPLLWGAVAAVLNFLPYIGSATTLVLLTLVAFVSFDSIGRVALVAGSYLALATLEGQVVEPLFLGRRLALNPLIVFLALWFGGWFWGIAGIILAVPAVVVVKVSAEHAKRGRPLQEFLSPEDAAGGFTARNVGATLRARGQARARKRKIDSTIVQVGGDESIEQARAQAELDRTEEQSSQAR